MRINSRGYVTRNISSRNVKGTIPRDWWLVKYRTDNRSGGYVAMGIISIPKHLVGKKLRFKVEVFDDG